MSVNLFAVCWLFYQMFYQPQLDIIHNEPFPVRPASVERGGVIQWEIEYTKTNDFPATIHRNIICEDGNLVTLASSVTNAPKGNHLKAINQLEVPLKTSLGVCYMELTADYEINNLRTVSRTYISQPFIVTK